MIQSLLTGFFLGLSLIVAIGAQNTFVLRQGIIRQHIFYVALFCAVSDALLISIGIAGISIFLDSFISHNLNILFGLSALWLGCYAIFKLKSALNPSRTFEIEISNPKSLLQTLSSVAILTFLNPHVYLDTMILIGSVSQQFSGLYKITFGLGACLASFVFFFILAYAAKLLTPIMRNPFLWKIIDSLIALIMITIAYKLASAGNWL